MARTPRTVLPGLPHHVTQRGNRRQPTFFSDLDRLLYLDILADECARHDVEIWAYCLMPNHVHLAAVPGGETSLRRAIGETHRRYTRDVNERQGWTGYLWQGRFSSFVMDERHTLGAARYIEMNPVRAGLVERPDQYPWSSARAHLSGSDDVLVRVAPLLRRVPDWARFLRCLDEPDLHDQFRRHQRTGRPMGSDEFVTELERRLGRTLRPQTRGPKLAATRLRSIRPESEIVSPKLISL